MPLSVFPYIQPTWRFCRRWRWNMKLFRDGRRTLQRPESGMISLLKLRTTFALWKITSAFPVSHSCGKLINKITPEWRTSIKLRFLISSQLNGSVLGNPENVWYRCSRNHWKSVHKFSITIRWQAKWVSWFYWLVICSKSLLDKR